MVSLDWMYSAYIGNRISFYSDIIKIIHLAIMSPRKFKKPRIIFKDFLNFLYSPLNPIFICRWLQFAENATIDSTIANRVLSV